MSDPTLNYLPCVDNGPGHRMAYWQWGNGQAAHTVVCVHGLSRQGRDFDVLAQALVARAAASGQPIQVICPDVVGRGQSDWLANPQGYQLPTYAADMLTLLAHLKPVTLDWVGTSMGGLIGMAVCAHAASVGVAVRRLVLNDVGPVIQWEALARIATYLGHALQFGSLQQAADAMWAISTSFGPHTPAQWLELSRHMVKPLPDASAGVTLHYDPAIAVPFRTITQDAAVQGEAALWQLYDSLTAQTLLLRGAQSDLLSPQTAQQMTARGPRARLLEFAGVGHAPTLIAPDQVEAVASFLLA
ncbi:MAG: alpha/beta hydrolase [Rhodoferax sp.]|nr:alpha/beta hydrolase [Rhodoferax sp.]MDP3652795.1 alpha/beta hydrolase [Rhodoferax sp.]